MSEQMTFDQSPDVLEQRVDEMAALLVALTQDVQTMREFCKRTYMAMHFDLCVDEDQDERGKWQTCSVVRGISDKHDEELGELYVKLTGTESRTYDLMRAVDRRRHEL